MNAMNAWMRSLLLVACGFTLVLSACSARRGEPIVGPLTLDERLLAGQQAFMQHCHQCHTGGEAALGPALNNKPLPKFLMRLQVRQGLGAMPGFSKSEFPPEELDDLLRYVVAVRHHD